MGMPSTSAVTCITKGLLREIPPRAMTASMGTPSLRNCSTMAREPNAVASTSARKIFGAVVPSVSPTMAPFRVWSAKGVLLPLSQSSGDNRGLRRVHLLCFLGKPVQELVLDLFPQLRGRARGASGPLAPDAGANGGSGQDKQVLEPRVHVPEGGLAGFQARPCRE